ncbi:zinc ABC transporter permease subunit ZnuB [Azospirillum sp. YIM DDC1]|uniref:High-affinity zinc uptake system membrane protein ZnuB n=1 Tax=Azospirillum aestuarii TaxID=2802052 RepID=A0ABS1HVM7_9PROT|nr:zinc ABC transporter permease subunit ZnuB [Azospirillum aestuarii]MBK3776718.1 zinc ABC transporter permease subunit ZnuB [Azospirillum brasilense]MBK4718870.1 zinc ABC transporter permease subunit ZnuB [Azospirillum aestuarii]TWA95495.1 zinc transport system permease protein [Azospirillum brasilense]
MDDFVLRALAAGCGIALVAGPLGSFVVWRRMAYFGDTLAHSALLGVALGFLLGVNPLIGVVGVCVALALALVGLQRRRALATDTVLGILSHSSLSLGLVAIAFLETLRVDLVAYLFGDILSVTTTDLGWIYAGGAAALGGLLLLWRRLLAVTVDEDLARVEGMPVEALRLAFMLLIALVIAAAMKIVGILLITSLLIIPAAAARRFSRTPEAMAALASVFGIAAVLGGLLSSLNWDLPGGPSIVVAAAALFLASMMVPVANR